ncbi:MULTISPECIES: hypothetical protein [Cyanophyceae]|uniref:hypothetical protein n=1 Tax=Cyanophyceae TaxID=3028117 RepID=UPI001686E07B|nr:MULTISPECIES: hypothetical protein [Cyanophyceae]MBD1918890.1 hypothetical protein [Phormidium sp. FACHB-77]MBD2033268.1 hypothetical protein [Phormidium sp. FACHB-322]MBD2053799.1 hypothetical protein [Leptolyngbya sp. FACHB-60]
MKFIAQNIVQITAAGVLAIAGVACIAAGLDTETRTRQQVQLVIERNKLDAWQEEQLVTTAQSKAAQRYQQGCIVSRGQLQAGLAIPGLPDRQAVCDRFGITGVVIGGVVQDIAITNDQTLIFTKTGGL